LPVEHVHRVSIAMGSLFPPKNCGPFQQKPYAPGALLCSKTSGLGCLDCSPKPSWIIVTPFGSARRAQRLVQQVLSERTSYR
jgi:hypothetical protein